MTSSKKYKFFIFHFLNNGAAICLAAYFKIISHDQAEIALGAALLYSLFTFGAFVRHRVLIRRQELK